MYAIFFTTLDPAIQVAVTEGKSVNVKFYKSKALTKLKKHFSIQRSSTGLANVRLLYDNASSHKTSIVQDFLKQEKMVLLPHPPYSPDLVLGDSLFLVETLCSANTLVLYSSVLKVYSRTSVDRTLMARLPRLFRTRY